MSDSKHNSGHSKRFNRNSTLDTELERRQVSAWLRTEQWDDLPCPTRSRMKPWHGYDRKGDTPSWREYPYSQNPGRTSLCEFYAHVMPEEASSVIFFEGEPWWNGIVGYKLKVRRFHLMPGRPMQTCLDQGCPIFGLMRPLTQGEIDIYFRLSKRDRKEVTRRNRRINRYTIKCQLERWGMNLPPEMMHRDRKDLMRLRRKRIENVVARYQKRLDDSINSGASETEVAELRRKLTFAKNYGKRQLER